MPSGSAVACAQEKAHPIRREGFRSSMRSGSWVFTPAERCDRRLAEGPYIIAFEAARISKAASGCYLRDRCRVVRTQQQFPGTAEPHLARKFHRRQSAAFLKGTPQAESTHPADVRKILQRNRCLPVCLDIRLRAVDLPRSDERWCLLQQMTKVVMVGMKKHHGKCLLKFRQHKVGHRSGGVIQYADQKKEMFAQGLRRRKRIILFGVETQWPATRLARKCGKRSCQGSRFYCQNQAPILSAARDLQRLARRYYDAAV